MRETLYVLVAAVLFGTTGTAQAFLPEGTDPVSVGVVRAIVGGLSLIALALLSRARAARRAPESPSPDPTAPDPTALPPNGLPSASGMVRRIQWVALALGAIGAFAYQPLFFLGTSTNGVAVGTLVALGSAPVLTGIIEWLRTGRFPGPRWLAATLVATAGVAVLSGLFTPAAATSTAATANSTALSPVLGVLASLGAGASYAAYATASKMLLDRGWSATESMAGVFGGAAAIALCALPFVQTGWVWSPVGASVAVWLGLATITVAYLFFAAGMRRLRASTVTTFTLAEPLTATVLGLLVLGERLTVSSIVGVALLVVGLALLTFSRPRRAPHRTATPPTA